VRAVVADAGDQLKSDTSASPSGSLFQKTSIYKLIGQAVECVISSVPSQINRRAGDRRN